MRKILGALRRADEKFHMINEGDCIAVGLSGGKDSLVLLYALSLYKLYIKKNYTIIPITVDLGFGNFDTAQLKSFCADMSLDLHVVKTDIGKIVFDIRKEKNPCSLCAKMRKGAFYSKAKELLCNKAAFAHHADDAADTFLLSLLYESNINTLKPVTYLSRQDITLLRPLILSRESDIIDAQKKFSMPIVKNPCPASGNTKREEIKEIEKLLSRYNPDAKDSILRAVCAKLLK